MGVIRQRQGTDGWKHVGHVHRLFLRADPGRQRTVSHTAGMDRLAVDQTAFPIDANSIALAISSYVPIRHYFILARYSSAENGRLWKVM